MKKIFLFILTLLSVLSLSACKLYDPRWIIPDNKESQSSGEIDQLQRKIFDYYKQNYYKDIDEQLFDRLKYGSLENFMSPILDKYSRVFVNYPELSGGEPSPYDQKEEARDEIGVSFEYQAKFPRLIVKTVYRQSSAFGKLYPTDEILGVVNTKNNDEKLYFEQAQDITARIAVQMIRTQTDENNGKVKLIVQSKDANDERIVEVERRKTYHRSVEELNTADPKTAVIRISEFKKDITGDAFVSLLDKLEKSKLTSNDSTLILDLRNNPGGELGALETIVGALLPKSENPYAKLVNSKTKEEHIIEGKLERKKPYNIKVLVNQNSASAAEVLAACLKYGGGYKLYGTETFGKNIYQSYYVLQQATFSKPQITLSCTQGFWHYFDHTQNKWQTLDKENNPFEVEKLPDENAYTLNDKQDYFLDKDIKKDTVNPEAKAIQRYLSLRYAALLKTNSETLRTDGYIDETTIKYLKKFQADSGLTVSETGDINTRKALYKAMSTYYDNPDTEFLVQFAKAN